MLRSRRRPRYGTQACATVSAVLLLASVTLLYTRLSLYSSHSPYNLHSKTSSDQRDAVLFPNPLVSDSDEQSIGSNFNEDKIDELDNPEDDPNDAANTLSNEDDENQDIELEQEMDNVRGKISSSGYYFDHINGVIRRRFNKISLDEWDYDYSGFAAKLGGKSNVDKSKAAFGSDDIPVDEGIRRKMIEVTGIEDALFLKIGKRVSPLREGWGEWFDKKADFLRRDKMFKSNLEMLNPLNNPLLQDPDGIGAMGLTRGDKVVLKWMLNEFKRVPLSAKKPLIVLEVNGDGMKNGDNRNEAGRGELKRVERKTLDNNLGDSFNIIEADVSSRVLPKKSENVGVVQDTTVNANKGDSGTQLANENSSNDSSISAKEEMGGSENTYSKSQDSMNETSGHVYADGKRWGYYPGLDPRLPFSSFMEHFFRKENCSMRVFMVWNSPPWMFSVRQQRGLESLLAHHRDACVVVFSETIELDFFRDSFVKDGFKVATAMPNLDELLKDTPTHAFASVWFDWRKTKYYATHYSELVRLAAIYKYGGIYLDSDIIVLGSLSLLKNSVGMDDPNAEDSLNGAVMAFRRQSPFILECLNEYYMTYNDKCLRCNGANLLTRVAGNFLHGKNKVINQQELKIQSSFIFFPIGSQHITSYFTTPTTETEKVRQDVLFMKIKKESLTFHFWNSLTSTIAPEPASLVSRLIDLSCIRCSDLL